MSRILSRPALLLVFALVLAACGSPAATNTPANSSAASTAATSESGSKEPAATTRVTLGLGYRPDVQFAPFYMATQKGYYKAAGLDVEFKHMQEPELLKLVGTGKLNYAVASGDEMLLARSQGVPLIYVGAYFHKYPVALITRKESGITDIAGIKGKTVGVPGLFGATYTGLKALLLSAGMKESDVTVKSIGFTQVKALKDRQVDAVMGYANNEPLQLEKQGVLVKTFPVWESADLISNGIITNEKNLSANPDEVARLVKATMRGLSDTIADPEAALEATLKYVPEAGGENRETALNVLKASIPLWQSEAAKQHGLGYTDPKAWEATRDFLKRSGALTEGVDVQAAYSNKYITE